MIVPHLTDDHIKRIGPGDRVYGVLPLHLIHRVLRRGAEYYAVVLPRVPGDMMQFHMISSHQRIPDHMSRGI